MKNKLLLVSFLSLICLPAFFIPNTIDVEINLYPQDFSGVLRKGKETKEPSFLDLFEEVRDEFTSFRIDFLEVNLQEMQVRFYEDGFVKKEVPINKKGDPQDWGGTSVGIYQVGFKSRDAFSAVAEVYMPYSIRLYGKYYLHGEPYYPDGALLVSEASGGCVQLTNENAKSIYELAQSGMPILVIDKLRDNYPYSQEKPSEFPEVSTPNYLVSDLDSGFIFAEKDSQMQLPMASLTKLMTAVVVSENIDLRKTILVREEMLDAYGDTTGLEAGKRFGIVELFYPLLIESSNDAAEALSYYLGRERTIRLMNEKAKAILMRQTNFIDPSGYDPQNISTAQDIFYLTRYVLNNRPPLFKITRGEKVGSFKDVTFNLQNLWNKNLFAYDPTFVGGKTGFIKNSKYTGVFIFKMSAQDGKERNIAIILLGSDNLESDTQRIYKWLQENYFKQ